MPKSKHRRKGGGKSAKHPGRNRTEHGNNPFDKFRDRHVAPFHREFPEKDDAGLIMGMLSEFYAPETGQAVCNKVELIAEFIGDDYEDTAEGAAAAEAAIEWLRDHGWVAVDGEDVRIIPRESAATRV